MAHLNFDKVFAVSDYVVRQSRGKFVGNKLPDETVRIVESFYQDNEVTRQMSGKRITLALPEMFMLRRD